MMAFPQWLLILIVLFHHTQNEGVIAQYQWNCSMPDECGERYIPGVRDYPSNVSISITDGRSINLYHVQNLTSTECTGEVTAIEFCYRHSVIGQGEPAFNWTVLILEETNVFTIRRIFVIESRPNSLSEGDCVSIAATVVDCCDREYISNFNFIRNNFVFGVTESAQGNTHKATLLRFSNESLPEHSRHHDHSQHRTNYSNGFCSTQAVRDTTRPTHALVCYSR